MTYAESGSRHHSVYHDSQEKCHGVFHNDKNSNSQHWVSSQNIIQLQAKWELIWPINHKAANVTYLVLSSVTSHFCSAKFSLLDNFVAKTSGD